MPHRSLRPVLAVLALAPLLPGFPPAARAQDNPAEAALYSGSGRFEFASGDRAVGIPFELNSGKLYIHTFLNGRGPFWLVLDTGSPGLILDTATAATLGLEVGEASGTVGAGEGDFPLAPVRGTLDAALPGLRLLDQPAAVGPLNQVVGVFEGRAMEGLLGCHNLVTNLVMEVDYERGLLSFIEPDAYVPEPGAKVVRMENREGHPFIQAVIQPSVGQPVAGWYWVDTGMRGTLFLTTPFVRNHGLLQRSARSVWAVTGGGIGGQVHCHVGRFRSLTFGDITIENPDACLTDVDSGLMSYDFAAGILGSRILQRFRVVFDFRRSRILFHERQGLNPELVDFDKSGMFLVLDAADRSRIRVVDVIAGSPAEAAGVRVGDALTNVAGMDAAGMGLERIRRRFQGPEGTSVPLVLDREGTPVRTAVVLRRVV